MRRLAKELKIVEGQKNPQLTVRPSTHSFLEWHFVLHQLPSDSVYKGGYYHGKLLFTEQYPMAPPAVLMVTPSGRFEPYRRLCLTMTDWMPETWNPAWTMDTILIGLISFMVDVTDPVGVGVVHATADCRKRLASSSLEFNRKNPEFCELFPEFTASGFPMGTEEEEKVEVQPSPGKEADFNSEEAGWEKVEVQTSPGKEADLNSEEAEDEPGSESLASPSIATGDPAAAPAEEAAAAVTAVVATGAEVATTGQRAGKAEKARAAAKAKEEEDEELTECWICYQDGAQEPLIRPCGCRGSMSGVHASCVQDWINTHRCSAKTGERPKCGVCKKAYPGRERRPGPGLLARQVAGFGLCALLRMVCVFYGIIWYMRGAFTDNHRPFWYRLQLITLGAVYFGYENLVLAFSLPEGQRPPPRFFERLFFSRNSNYIFLLGTQLGTNMLMGLYLVAVGEIELRWFLPYACYPLLPLLSLYRGLHPAEFANFMTLVFLVPCRIIRFAILNPQILLNPADAGFHIIVAYTIIPCCWCVESKATILLFVATHSSVIFVALLEKIAVKKMYFEDNEFWWGLIPIYAFSALNVISCYAIMPGSTAEGKHWVWLMSLLWFALVTALALIVEGPQGAKHYEAWQNRHGSFELQWEAPPQAAQKAGVARAKPAVEGRLALGIE